MSRPALRGGKVISAVGSIGVFENTIPALSLRSLLHGAVPQGVALNLCTLFVCARIDLDVRVLLYRAILLCAMKYIDRRHALRGSFAFLRTTNATA